LDAAPGKGTSFRDPFGETADPDLYVPRPATEACLDGAARALLEESRSAAILGLPGVGKTTLLHALARRVEGRLTPLTLPYAAMGLHDLAHWVLGLWERPAEGDDAEAALRDHCRRLASQGSALALLVDDADSMPLATARGLSKLAVECEGGLRLAVAATEGAAASRVLAVLGSQVAVHRLTLPMSAQETGAYLRGRLARCGAPAEIARRFDAAAVAWIQSLAGGIPRRVHEIARRLVEAAPADVPRALAEERWLGSPLDELLEGEGGAEDLSGYDLPDLLLDAEEADEGEDPGRA
jgi:type II secretory pathway predicted ATPase ExeA